MSPHPSICLITGNAGKAREFSELLGFDIEHQKLDLTEVQALDVSDVAGAKAQEAFNILNRPVMVDDTGFSVHAWNGLPGAFIAWFLKTVDTGGLLKMAASLEDRGVDVTTAIGYADSSGVRVFTGTVTGTLPIEERGTEGFGYDPIFVPEGYDKTFAEMTADEKNAISMRRRAVDEMKRDLRLDSHH